MLVMKKTYVGLILLVLCIPVKGKCNLPDKIIFTNTYNPKIVELNPYAQIADAQTNTYSVYQVINGQADSLFKPFATDNNNLGFTLNTFWVRFSVQNLTEKTITYYLEAGEPYTYLVKVHCVRADEPIEILQRGGLTNTNKGSIYHRRPFFPVELEPSKTIDVYIEIQNDGDRNCLPLRLVAAEQVIKETFINQIFIGVFLGVLLVVIAIYLFLYTALFEKAFLYYVLYLSSIVITSLCLDGIFFQYFWPKGLWLTQRIIPISLLLGGFLFGVYFEAYIKLKKHLPRHVKMFRIFYALIFVQLFIIMFVPPLFNVSHVITYVLISVGMLLVCYSILIVSIKRLVHDPFFFIGIAILFSTFMFSLLNNFNFIHGIWTLNISKAGVVGEVIFLSLSMTNRVRKLKAKKEKLQQDALKASEEMNNTKSFFLSNMSHELRTPLNAILGITGALQNEIADSTLKSQFETIQYASANLLSSVNDILDFSAIKEGKLTLKKETFNPYNTILQICNIAQKEAYDKRLKFEFTYTGDTNVWVLGDSQKLHQIIRNIVNNAVKFTVEGTVNVQVKLKL
jgi:signal transduction histidine kinase